MALRAMRGYKQQLAGIVAMQQQQAVKREEQAIQQAHTERVTSKEYLAQVDEFEAFLTSEAGKERPFHFLVDMYNKHKEGTVFTSRMQDAIRKCMMRAAEAKVSDMMKPPITLSIPLFLMNELKLDSRVITGTVLRETEKAWLLKGHADMLETLSWCVRCGRELKEPASQVTGMGRICAEKSGIPYDAKGVLDMSKKERAAIRKKFVQKLHQQTFERWIPKAVSQVLTNN